MQRKKYKVEDYNKAGAYLDATRFFLIYEGNVKEPNYFEAFRNAFMNPKKAYLHHILESSTGIIGNNPLKLKERAQKFLKEPPKNLSVTPGVDDKFRFVLDVDKHPQDQIEELINYCASLKNAQIYLSNFCFEVWLWSHIEPLDQIKSTTPKELKTELGTLEAGNYPFFFMDIKLIQKAINECRLSDQQKENYYPDIKNSKIYLLIEELLDESTFAIKVIT